MSRKIVLTGATGLLGSRTASILAPTDQVIALGRSPVSDVENITVDLARPLRREALPERIDAVIHLAQSRRFREFPGGASDVSAINTQATVALAEYAVAAGATHFIYASTGGVYAPSAEPLTEDAPLADASDMSFYAASKLAAERLLAPFAQRLNLIILRPFFVYGPGQDRGMLVPRLIDAVKADKPVQLSGPDGVRFNPVHVLDAAAAFAAALQLQGTHVVNVAGPQVLTLRDAATEIGRAVGKNPLFEAGPEQGTSDLIGETCRLEMLLAKPTIRFADRLGDLA